MFVLQFTTIWTGSSYIHPVIYHSLKEAENDKSRLESMMSSTGKIKNNTIAIRSLV